MRTVREWVSRHPYLTMWAVLAVVMVALLLVLGPTQSTLEPREMVVIALATVGLAGLCVWIISWE